MPNNLPLSAIVSQVIANTPHWVWAILFGITVLGLRQAFEHVATARRLTISPVALAAFSLLGAASAFGARPEVLGAWAAGMALALVVIHQLPATHSAQYQGAGRYAVKGSIWPLLAMWSVFAVRYVTAVTLVLHPGLAHNTTFALVMPLVYGGLSGLFLARALRILRSAPPAGELRLA